MCNEHQPQSRARTGRNNRLQGASGIIYARRADRGERRLHRQTAHCIFGDKDGTFHNFGGKDYIIRAFPVTTNQFPQTKVFRTGGWFSDEDQIPSRIYFEMEQQGSGFSIDLKPRY